VGQANPSPVGEKGDDVNGREQIGAAHRVLILPVVRDRPPCPPDCETGNLCAWCDNEVRAEALEWIRAINAPTDPGERFVQMPNPNGWRWDDHRDRSSGQR
jgi:hypothetical protein